jgi:aspartyl-tRNA(Asn)/glutamyl-tRNA(Gln) amidotransferase subunit A
MSGPARPTPLDVLRRTVAEGRGAELLAAGARALAAADAGPRPVHAFLAARFDADPAGAGGPPQGALAGLPVAVKDNLATLDFPTTCGSRILEGYRSPYDATVVRRLRAAGAAIVGKTNLDEFGMGSSTEHSAFGPTRNPWDRARVPGGSSGGSAAAIAAGIVPLALGSDTGGSVRQPAAYCGVVGIRPTYGRVSRYGLVAFASSLDQVGVLAGDVAGAAALLEAVAGHDPRDATSVALAVGDLERQARAGAEGLVVGVPREYFPHGLDAGIAALCQRAIHRLAAAGAEIREVSLPSTVLAVPAYQVLAAAEASSNLARFDGVRFGVRIPGTADLAEMQERTRALFGTEARRRILLGTFVLSAGQHDALHERAQRARRAVAAELRGVFRSGVDALFTPTTPGPAFRLGERLADPCAMYLSDAFTVGASLAGSPALSLPIGRVAGLPVGGQLIADRWREGAILRLAGALERALGPGWSG